MTDALEVYNIDREDFHWESLALCEGQPTDLFFDDYEESIEVAKMVDDMCLSCPVMSLCLKTGVDEARWGVWGGIFLVRGKPSKERNAHKSKKTWGEIKERLAANALDNAY